MKIVDLSFFESDTVKVAKELIGKILSVESDAGILTGRIVETEAYLGSEDPAAHSFNGKTKRTSPMFEKGGNIYIYMIYGIYYCLNFSTEKEGIGNAVLIRAIEPLDGLDIMKKNRNKSNIHDLCSGPGKLCQALGIDIRYNDHYINSGPIKLFDDNTVFELHSDKRIGINKAKEKLLRFHNNTPFVSKI